MANEMLFGFHDLADREGENIYQLLDEVEAAVDSTLEEHTRQTAAMEALFCDSTTQVRKRYRTTAYSGRLAPTDDLGRLPALRTQYSTYDVAWPLQKAGVAWGMTTLKAQQMTVRQLSNLLNKFLVMDLSWLAEHILAAIFTDANWVLEDEEWGTLTMLPLANGDGQLYMPKPGDISQGVTSNHFSAQAADIDDDHNPFPLIVETMVNHPENGGDVLIFVASDLVNDVEALATFYKRTDPNLSVPDTQVRLIGDAPGVVTPGRLLGYVAAWTGCWVYEWSRLPNGYMVTVMTQGDRPVMKREHELPNLRGFINWADRMDAPYFERQLWRWAGYGVNNRVGAMVTKIGSGSYSIPTNLTAPIY